MTKEKLFQLMKDERMEPLIDDENTGMQLGWTKLSRIRIPSLDTFSDDMGGMIQVQVHKISSTYRYTVYCPVGWFLEK